MLGEIEGGKHKPNLYKETTPLSKTLKL